MSEKLISQNEKDNTRHYLYSYSIELAEVCRDDLVIISNKWRKELGAAS